MQTSSHTKLQLTWAVSKTQGPSYYVSCCRNSFIKSGSPLVKTPYLPGIFPASRVLDHGSCRRRLEAEGITRWASETGYHTAVLLIIEILHHPICLYICILPEFLRFTSITPDAWRNKLTKRGKLTHSSASAAPSTVRRRPCPCHIAVSGRSEHVLNSQDFGPLTLTGLALDSNMEAIPQRQNAHGL